MMAPRSDPGRQQPQRDEVVRQRRVLPVHQVQRGLGGRTSTLLAAGPPPGRRSSNAGTLRADERLQDHRLGRATGGLR